MKHSLLKWDHTTLGKFISIKRGYDLTSKERKVGNIPVYGAAGHNGYHNEIKAKAPGIIIGRSGGSFGQIHFVTKDFWPHNTSMYVTDFKGNDPDFVYYLLKLLDFSALNSGSAQPSLNRNFLYPIKIRVPKSQEQTLIGTLLKQIDQKIILNNKINAELEAMAKLIYDYWFVQFDFPDANGKPYKSSGGKMVYNEVLKRKIPEGWEVGKFGDYAKVKSGFAFKSSWWQKSGIPVIKIKDIQENNTLNQTNLSFVSLTRADTANKYVSKPNDVVIAMTGATIGKFAIIPQSETPLLINQRVGLYDLGVNPISKLPFLINSMKQDFFRSMIFQLAGGAAQPNISSEQLDNLPLVIPTGKLTEKYNVLLSANYEKYSNNELESQSLSILRDWLLPMLMNGQVTVKNS